MTSWKSIFKYTDVGIGLLALLAPQFFITALARIIEITLPIHTKISLNSYGLVLVAFAAAFSWIRKASPSQTETTSTSAMAMNCLIALGGIAIIATSMMSNDVAITPKQVTSPYIVYALSVALCFGIGYAISDLIRTIIKGRS